jgi:hypothetical protein
MNATKEITILKRAEVKKASAAYNVNPGDVIHIVKGEKNSIHVVTLRNNGHNSCTCVGNAQYDRHCYHLKGCEHANNAHIEATKVTEEQEWIVYRLELAKRLASQYMTVQIVEEVVAQLIAPAKPKSPKVAQVIEQAVQAVVPAAKTTDVSDLGDLGGTKKYALLR